MNAPLRLQSSDFPHALLQSNHIYTQFSRLYEIDSTSPPVIVLYGPWGRQFLQHSCIRVYYTGENTRPNFRECDYAISFDHNDHPRHYRFPDYAAYHDPVALTKKAGAKELARNRSHFCAFIYSNPTSLPRIRFFQLLQRYRPVDSLGRVLPNQPVQSLPVNRNAADWKYMSN